MPSYKMIDRMILMRLTGSAVDRAKQHGQFAKEILSKSNDPMTIHSLAHKNQTLIERVIHSKILTPVYESLVTKILVPRLPKDIREVIEATIQASGAEAKEAWLALYQPDMMMVLAAVSTERYRNLFLEGMPGCSTVILNKTDQREFYFSRNLDYPAASTWERWPTIFYHEPNHAQKYFHVASLGIHTPGLTAANESGIAFSLHAHFSKKFSLRGIPSLFAGTQILEKAHTLNEAVDVLRKFKPMGNWAFNLASFNENKAVSVEIAEGKVFLREIDAKGTIAHTNGFQHDELLPNQLHFNGSVVEDLYCRKSNMESFVNKHSPDYGLKESMLAIGSHVDPKTGAVRVYGNTVSVITTIQSIIFEPHTDSFYVSSRAESPTPLGPYLKFPTKWENLGDEHFNQKAIEVPHGYNESFLRAVHHYHVAYVAWHVNHLDEAATLPDLEVCSRFAPDDPHVHIQKGYFELRTGKYEAAKNSFAEALKHVLSPNLEHVATYFLAASFDLLGSREKALEQYRKLSDGKVAMGTPLDPKIQRRIKKRLNKPWKSSDCQKIQPDLQFVEPLDYP